MIGSITGVFTEIIDWFVLAIQSIMGIFWTTEGGLTVIGTLSVISLAIGITLLLVNVIRDYLKFR